MCVFIQSIKHLLSIVYKLGLNTREFVVSILQRRKQRLKGSILLHLAPNHDAASQALFTQQLELWQGNHWPRGLREGSAQGGWLGQQSSRRLGSQQEESASGLLPRLRCGGRSTKTRPLGCLGTENRGDMGWWWLSEPQSQGQQQASGAGSTGSRRLAGPAHARTHAAAPPAAPLGPSPQD